MASIILPHIPTGDLCSIRPDSDAERYDALVPDFEIADLCSDNGKFTPIRAVNSSVSSRTSQSLNNKRCDVLESCQNGASLHVDTVTMETADQSTVPAKSILKCRISPPNVRG